jgi:hypothetical protein
MNLNYGERYEEGPTEWMKECARQIIRDDESPILDIYCYFWHVVVYELEGVLEKREKKKNLFKLNQWVKFPNI